MLLASELPLSFTLTKMSRAGAGSVKDATPLEVSTIYDRLAVRLAVPDVDVTSKTTVGAVGVVTISKFPVKGLN
jgi:hypothetical protein